MTWRRPASRGLFGLGVLLAVGAVALLLSAAFGNNEGFEDLGKFVGALLLAGVAGIPFALSLLLARGDEMPRWMVAVAAVGCVLALLTALALFSSGVTNAILFGLVFLAAAALGLGSLPRAWRPASR